MIYKRELKRLLGLRTIYAFLLIMAASAAVGAYYDIDILSPQRDNVTAASMLLDSAKGSALIGSIAFAFFTILEMNRDTRLRVSLIVTSCTDSNLIIVPRILAVITTGLIGAVISLLSGFIALHRQIPAGGLALLLFSFGLITFAAILFTVFISSGIYLICQRVELGMMLYIGLLYMGISTDNNYLLNWITTYVEHYSDHFGNWQAVRLILWNRLLWLLISLTVFLLGLLCERRYGYKLFKSFSINLKRRTMTLALCMLFTVSAVVYVFEPLFTNEASPEAQNLANYERLSKGLKEVSAYDSICINTSQDKRMKIVSCYLQIIIDPHKGSLDGYNKLLIEKTIEGSGLICFRLEKGLNIKKILLNGANAHWGTLNENIYNVPIPDQGDFTLELWYEGMPENRGYLHQGSPDYTISKTYVYLANEACMPIPCFYVIKDTGYRRFMESKIDFRSAITLPDDFVAATTGETSVVSTADGSMKTWTSTFVMQKIPFITINASPYYVVTKCQVIGKTMELYCVKPGNNSVSDPNEIITSALKYYTQWLGSSSLKFNTLKLVERHINEDAELSDTNIVYIDESVFSKTGTDSGNAQSMDEICSLVSQVCRIWWGSYTLSISSKQDDSVSKAELFSAIFPDDTWGSAQLIEYCTYQYILDTYGEDSAKIIEASWKADVRLVLNNFYYENPQYLTVVPESFIDEVIRDINNIRYKKLIPLKMLIAARQHEDTWWHDKIAVLAEKFVETQNLSLFLEALEFTKEINVDKGDLISE